VQGSTLELYLNCYQLQASKLYMICYLNGSLQLISKEGFSNKETGEEVSYNKLYIESEEEDGTIKVNELNTKKDFSKFKGESITAKISVRKGKDGWQVSVIDITPQNEL